MKTFSTLTIRNLDSPENTKTVKIMNEIMQRFNIKTGQEIFEKAIYQYDYLQRQISDANLSHSASMGELQKEIRGLETEVARYRSFYQAYQVMNDLYLSIWQKEELNINN